MSRLAWTAALLGLVALVVGLALTRGPTAPAASGDDADGPQPATARPSAPASNSGPGDATREGAEGSDPRRAAAAAGGSRESATSSAPETIGAEPGSSPSGSGPAAGVREAKGPRGLEDLTPEQQAWIRERTRRDDEGLVEVQHPDGSTSVDLQGLFQHVPVARRNPDGTVTIEEY